MVANNHVNFPEQTCRQILRVLRLKTNDTVMVLDNSGKMYETTLVVNEQVVAGKILNCIEADTEPSVNICLVACVSHRDKYEWILQKGTEIGVTTFLPVISKRTLVQKIEAIEKKQERWEAIIQEAAEQSHRAKLPVLLPAKRFDEALTQIDPASCRLIAHTGSGIPPINTVLQGTDKNNFHLLVGPEGGFTPEEVDSAIRAGFQPVSLGNRIFRMETAALIFSDRVIYHSSSSNE
jgi:16S rRNA (uracil1498-N3)-methyltransferase